jgi:hypothetical protein
MVSRQQFYAIKNTLTKKEKELIDYYDMTYLMRGGYVPTIEEVAQKLSLSQVTVNYYLQRAPVVAALTKRGIPFRDHSQTELTATQVAAASVMMNFSDVRTNSQKLDALGINPTQYQAWLRQPQFKNLIDRLASENLVNITPIAITELTKKVSEGDFNAIKYYLDTTGAIQNNDQPQSEVLLRMIIEILQRHVKDADVLVAIANDIALAAANKTLEFGTHPQLEGEVVEDVELADARRKLNI